MNEVQLGGVLVVGLILGLVQLAKQAGLSATWAAPLAVALGVLLRVGYELAVAVGGMSWADAGLQGAALGLAAAGLYSGGRSLKDAETGGRGDAEMGKGGTPSPPSGRGSG